MFWLRVLERAKSVQHLLVNSCPDESGQQHEQRSCHRRPQPLPIGPLMLAHRTSNLSTWEEDRSCLHWLEQHPPGSVVYVSFGSWVAPLSPERCGVPGGSPGNLPGKIVAWAPQRPAVGCYLTHCGWNSTLEAIQHEKRLLCYPVAGDQFVNAAFIVKGWGIGAMLDGSAGSSAVEEGIKRVMATEEGAVMQERVLRLRRRVMGECGKSSTAIENLQCFFDGMNGDQRQKKYRKEEEIETAFTLFRPS
ncbi:UDP-glycosyltransferase 82A1-like [Zingiber officinale]|uniref:UDP-glycosyltransferase 82A1-like n=1 Tax=Zingiber officinale TaxID=94328 RepID=UPI001C4D554B|nr:UDP-glycosyltransferase 82A1-like [Zingiber officinale]